jgi:hypothetical protein
VKEMKDSTTYIVMSAVYAAIVVLTLTLLIGCASMPDGCHNDAYTGMQQCWKSNEMIGERQLTPEEHQLAIQIEMLKQQQQTVNTQMFMGGAQLMDAAQPRKYEVYHYGHEHGR